MKNAWSYHANQLADYSPSCPQILHTAVAASAFADVSKKTNANGVYPTSAAFDSAVTNATEPTLPDEIAVCEAIVLAHLAKVPAKGRTGINYYFADHESWEATGKGELSDILFLCSPQEGPPWRD
jgi:hypothetical protein